MTEMSHKIASYRLSVTLGVGTFGKVKLAVHEGTGQRVAVKIINKARMVSMEMHAKLRREIHILQSLTHPHVIRLYELIDTPTDIFVVMEYIPGGELFDYIVQKSRLHESEARRFFQQLISGVVYCHQRMVCHRDLKPENILLDTNLNIKIGDFGLSNFLKDGDFLKTSCGSPNYASPEVVSGKAYAGPEVDVWSCGVILYALLCGSLPFDDEHVPNLFQRIKHGNFNIPGHLSEGARNLIVRMLAVNPAKRITVREIKYHPWFRMNLQSYLAAPVLKNSLLSMVDHSIISDLQKIGYEVTADTIVLKNPPGKMPARETVAYQLLADKKARHAMSSVCGCWMSSSHSHSMQLLNRDPSNAPQNPRFLPAVFSRDAHKAACQLTMTELDYPTTLTSTSLNTSLMPGDLFIGTSNHGVNAFEGGDSPSSHWSAVTRWHLGIESILSASTIMMEIMRTLKSMKYEWYQISTYRIRCRPIAASEDISENNSVLQSQRSQTTDMDTAPQQPSKPDVESSTFPRKTSSSSSNYFDALLPKRVTPPTGIVLTIQLFKIATCRYLIDVQLFDGPVIASMSEALWVTSAIYSGLTQLQLKQNPKTDLTDSIFTAIRSITSTSL